MEEAAMANHPPVGFDLDRPWAHADECPGTDARHQAPPAVLAIDRFAADVAHHLFVAERRRLRVKVVLAERAKDQTLGLERRRRTDQAYFLPRESPPKRLLKRATWPPVSSSF